MFWLSYSYTIEKSNFTSFTGYYSQNQKIIVLFFIIISSVFCILFLMKYIQCTLSVFTPGWQSHFLKLLKSHEPYFLMSFWNIIFFWPVMWKYWKLVIIISPFLWKWSRYYLISLARCWTIHGLLVEFQ